MCRTCSPESRCGAPTAAQAEPREEAAQAEPREEAAQAEPREEAAQADTSGGALPATAAQAEPREEAAHGEPMEERDALGERAPGRVVSPPSGPRAIVAPLSPRRYLIRVTVGEETHAALGQLQDLLSHQVPDRDPAIIIARALELLLERTLARKAAVCERPREGKEPAKRNRHIPAAVRREVWQRDGARCAFVSEDGQRCWSTRFLEFHHTRNWGRGAEHEPGEVELRCRAHNQHQAELDYGAGLMAARRSRARERGVEYRRSRDGRQRCVRRTRPGACCVTVDRGSAVAAAVPDPGSPSEEAHAALAQLQDLLSHLPDRDPAG